MQIFPPPKQKNSTTEEGDTGKGKKSLFYETDLQTPRVAKERPCSRRMEARFWNRWIYARAIKRVRDIIDLAQQNEESKGRQS